MNTELQTYCSGVTPYDVRRKCPSSNGDLPEIDRRIRVIEIRFGNVGLNDVNSSVVRRKGSTHDEFAAIALSNKMQRTGLQAWEYFNEVLEKSELLAMDQKTYGRDMTVISLTKSLATCS